MTRQPLKDDEREQIEVMRKLGRLGDIEHHKVSHSAIVIACGDGHEYGDVFDHHRSTCKGSAHAVLHQHLVNGGPLVLMAGTRLNHGIAGDDLLIAQVGDSIQIKGIKNVVLRMHAPCGAARLLSLLPNDQILGLKEARSRLAQSYPDLDIACYYDVRYPDGDNRLRSYFVPMDREG